MWMELFLACEYLLIIGPLEKSFVSTFTSLLDGGFMFHFCQSVFQFDLLLFFVVYVVALYCQVMAACCVFSTWVVDQVIPHEKKPFDSVTIQTMAGDLVSGKSAPSAISPQSCSLFSRSLPGELKIASGQVLLAKEEDCKFVSSLNSSVFIVLFDTAAFEGL